MSTYPAAPAITLDQVAKIAAALGVEPGEEQLAAALAIAANTAGGPPPAAAPAPAAPAAAAVALGVPEPELPPVPPVAPVNAVPLPEPKVLPPVTHHEPMLTYGAAGDAVEKLVRLLAVNGYGNTSFATGDNPSRVLDNTVMMEVKRFAADNGVAEQLEGFKSLSVPAEQLVGEHVGPYTWQALIDGAKRVLQGV